MQWPPVGVTGGLHSMEDLYVGGISRLVSPLLVCGFCLPKRRYIIRYYQKVNGLV